MYPMIWNLSMNKRMGATPVNGLFKCPQCNTFYNPTYGPCPTCYPGRRTGWPLLAAMVALVVALMLTLPVAAQNRPFSMPVQALAGIVFVDLNGNGVKDYGEPNQAGVMVEARTVDSEIHATWSDTSTATGDYHLLVWDPGTYDLAAYCTESSAGLSSVYLCWRTPLAAPIAIDGSGKSVDVPLPARRVYLPIIRK